MHKVLVSDNSTVTVRLKDFIHPNYYYYAVFAELQKIKKPKKVALDLAGIERLEGDMVALIILIENYALSICSEFELLHNEHGIQYDEMYRYFFSLMNGER